MENKMTPETEAESNQTDFCIQSDTCYHDVFISFSNTEPHLTDLECLQLHW